MEEKRNKKVLFTGGHAASSAFVVAQEIKRQKLPWGLYWIGFGKSLEGEKVSTLSSIYFPKYGIKTHNLITGRVQRKWTIHTIPSLLKIPFGFFHAFWLLLKIRPNIILSFGGFSSFPVVVGAYILRIPVIIHEQTSVIGIANKYSSFFAKVIAISRESSREYFPKGKTYLTGNPIPKDLRESNKARKFSKTPVIMVTGGQSGATAINKIVGKSLTQLIKRYKIIHLTGLKDEVEYKSKRLRLEKSQMGNYTVFGIVDPKKFNEIFNTCDILISRAGANTVSKVVFCIKPSALIPYPYSYLDEQTKNAQFAAQYAGARVIKQETLTPQVLIKEINNLVENWKDVLKEIKSFKNPDKDADKKIVSLIKSCIV